MNQFKDIINQETFKYLLSKGGVSFLFRISGMVLSFLSIGLVLRFYSIETYGVFSLIQTIQLIVLAIFTLGIQNVLIIEINKSFNFNANQSFMFLIKSIKLTLLISILPITILFFFSDFLCALFEIKKLANSFKFLATILPFLLIHELLLYYYIALKKFIKFGFFMFVLPNLLFILFITFFQKVYQSDFHVIIFFGLSFVITLFIELVVIFPQLSYPSLITKVTISYREILRKALPMMFSGVIILLLNWTDILMLGIMTSEKEVGIYNASFKVGFIVLLVVSTLNVIVVPKISEYYYLDNKQQLKKLINNTTQLITVLTIPIVIILLLFGKTILAFLGADFNEGYFVLVLITLSSFFSSICGNVDQILNMTNNQNSLMKINCITLILNVILNYFFIQLHGINGAAFSSLVSTVFLNMCCVYLIKKKLGFYTLF